ncbi:ATP-binding protein [Jiangella endophytica]|uniref:ATP-binding protein n=1 Tax=Jiangella endophytica TaxID=1623398 RepID=UPI0018E5102B|nr:LuxR C-terminal-related transcriptional regulator [Jiangella endophytica]
MTTFIGRRGELSEARRLLSAGRLVTLTGAAGVGKTRLAIRMAAGMRRTFRDGVWFVPLAALMDENLLASTVAEALQLRQVSSDPGGDLAQYLESRQLLLVLDNCEHLTGSCAILAGKLLAASPELRILATSRHLLSVEGELVVPVRPLAVPAEGTETTEADAVRYDALALLVDRGRAVAPDFAVDATNGAAVLELCRRLDGMPLAIELAAVWLRTLTPQQIVDRLDDRFRLLDAGPRPSVSHRRALETTIAWSFDLCTPAERVIWSRLSVFAGGFDLDAAEAVCSGDGIERDDVLDLIAGLVHKSIIIREPLGHGTAAWYRLLETIKSYGWAAAGTDEQRRALRVRHRDHYRSLAERCAAESFGPRQGEWFIRLRREHGNIRTALEFCLTEPGEAAVGLEIAAAMWNFWFAGYLREGYEYLRRGLALAPEPSPARATALWAASYLALVAGDPAPTPAMLAEAAQLADRFDDARLRARISECLGQATIWRGDLTDAVAVLEDGLSRYQALGDPLGEFDVRILLSLATFFLDDARLAEHSRAALDLAETHGATSSKAYGLLTVGLAAWRENRYEAATDSLRQAVRLWQPMNDNTGIAFAVEGLAWCACATAPDTRAAALLGAARAVWRVSGARINETTPYREFDERWTRTVRHALGDESFQREFDRGAALSFARAVDLALGADTARKAEGRAPAAGVSSRRPGGLTRRELEIAELLAQGLSNKDIAARLVIAQRTAETHVEHILSKLGFTSRSQVARWLAGHREAT